MRLVDSVVSCTTAVVVDLAGEMCRLPGAGSFSAAVAECPLRYVLGQDIVEAGLQIIRQWPDLLDPANRRLRIPAENMWIEWQVPPSLSGRPHRQAGLLVQSSPDGRSGVVRGFRMSGHGPEAARIALRFDLNRPRPDNLKPRSYPVAFRDAAAALFAPYLTASVDMGWHRYFAATSPGPERIGEAIQHRADDIIADLLLLFAFARILNSRTALRRQEIDRHRLNAARLRTGKAPLLDHVELSFAIGDPPAIGAHRGAVSRNPARLHLVRGHLVRRRDTIFWRCPHLRGGGADAGSTLPIKTVHARL